MLTPLILTWGTAYGYMVKKRQLSHKEQRHNTTSLEISNGILPPKKPWIFENGDWKQLIKYPQNVY